VRAFRITLAVAAAAFAASTLIRAEAGTDSVADFYRGKNLAVIVGSEPGGGFDIFGRLLARHLGSHIPGNPNVIVQNMPGAGSLRATNYLYNVAPKDGTMIGIFASDMPLLGLLDQNPAVQFDPRKFTWLGSSSRLANDGYVLIVRKDAPVKTIEDARRAGGPELLLGGTAEGAASADIQKILRDALGLHIRQVFGYGDTAAILLALERGEIMGRTVALSAIRATRPDWLKPDSNFHLLVAFASRARLPDFPDVPTARELAISDAARALIEFTETPLMTMARPFAAPPGLPSDRAAALRAAFMATHRDPQYVADAARVGVEISPVSADEVEMSLDEMSRASPQTFDYVRKLYAKTNQAD
jgi:tripartite-type tricarboxylate transporter receptor subunit TctC